MNFIEGTGIRGELTLIVRDKYGKIKKIWNENSFGKMLREKFGLVLKVPFLFGYFADSMVIRNILTNAGFKAMALRCNATGTAFTFLAVGTGTTAAATTDTGLGSEITASGLERTAATCTQETTTVDGDTSKLDKTWTVPGTYAVTEAGAFNAATAGDMLGRQVFAALNLVSGDSLQILYSFKFASA